MKLMYIHDTLIDSEQANLVQVLHMCRAFSDNGQRVILAIPKCKKAFTENDCKKIIKKKIGIEPNFSVVPFRKITLFGKLNFIGGYFGVKQLIKKNRVDICIVRKASFIGLLLKSDMDLIYEAHNWQTHEGLKIFNFLWTKYLIKKSRDRRFLKFVAISKALGDYWKDQGIPKEKIFVGHDGFDHKIFSEKKDKIQTRRKIGLPEKQKIAVYTGSLYPDRGIERIIKLAEFFKDVLFLVVGGPEKQKEIYAETARLKNLKNILFTGYIPHHQVADYLFAADICLMIWTKKVRTIQYCSPMKMFEYMAAGQIIVGDGFPTIKEILDDGKTALLADPDSFADLKDRFQSALNNNSFENIAQNARKLALRQYTWNMRAKSILDQLYT